jgi:hypothetical protein
LAAPRSLPRTRLCRRQAPAAVMLGRLAVRPAGPTFSTDRYQVQWVNNPTLTEFCFGMIGRADIEGSKSDVAMNAWPPQASSFLPTGLHSSPAPRFSATQPVDAAPSRVGVARTLSGVQGPHQHLSERWTAQPLRAPGGVSVAESAADCLYPTDS